MQYLTARSHFIDVKTEAQSSYFSKVMQKQTMEMDLCWPRMSFSIKVSKPNFLICVMKRWYLLWPYYKVTWRWNNAIIYSSALEIVSAHVLSCIWLFVNPWTVARQAPLSMGFSRQEYWSGLPFPSSGDLPHSETCLSCISCVGRWSLYPGLPTGALANINLKDNW